MNKKLFTCTCNDCSHNIILAHDPNYDTDDIDFLYVHVHLITYQNFFSRLVKAFKYLFKLEADEWGHYSEVILSKESALEMAEFIKSADK